jgi:hypothetical protein
MYILTTDKGRRLLGLPAYLSEGAAKAAARDFAIIGEAVRVAFVRGR